MKLSFIRRHVHRRNSAGGTIMKEDFFLNNAPAAGGGIFECFAYGESYWGREMTQMRYPGGYISFNLYLAGGAEIRHRNRQLSVQAGDLLVARFRDEFTIRTGPEGTAVKRCLLLTNTEIQAAICRRLFPEDLTIIRLENFEEVRKLLEEIGQNVKFQRDGAKLPHQILDFLEAVNAGGIKQQYPDLLQEALRFADAPGNQAIGREELAAHCGVSVSTLTRLFVGNLGIPPGQYLIQQRLEKAKRLLMLNLDSMKNIAYECGFSSPMFFSREFRARCGLSPSEYRSRTHRPELNNQPAETPENRSK